jgi:hypothetical protein
MRTIKALIILIVMATAAVAHAQEAPYKFDFGAGLGMSGYSGDASSSVFKHPGFVGEIGFRYLPDTRWAIRGVLSTLSLSGNTADMDNVLPEGKEYSFSSQVYDLGARIEFNFFSYGIGETYKRLRRWTPYLVLGVGVTLASCDGNTAIGPNVPMGAGIKYKLKERLNLGLEFTMTKVFNDHVDGKELSDLTTIKSSFVKNNDWYSRLTIGITYEFGKRCETCHYVE